MDTGTKNRLFVSFNEIQGELQKALEMQYKLIREILATQGGAIGGNVCTIGDCDIESVFIFDGEDCIMCHINYRGVEHDVYIQAFNTLEIQFIICSLLTHC